MKIRQIYSVIECSRDSELQRLVDTYNGQALLDELVQFIRFQNFDDVVRL